MPNQRKKGKRQIAVWLTDNERDTLKRIAEGRGISLTELIRRIALGKEKENGNEKDGD